jgi:hypothetical protein
VAGQFVPNGDLEAWQNDMGRVMPNQSILLFLMSLAFLAPLLRFLPKAMQKKNPQVEIIGPSSCGKTSAAVAVASVFAGDPESGSGGGENWDLSFQKLDDLKRTHRDTLLLLDESNHAISGNLKFLQQAVFKLSDPDSRKIYGKLDCKISARLAVLSTANQLVTHGMKRGFTAGAVESRRISIVLPEDREFGVLDFCPSGFSSPAAAMEHLRHAAGQCYGVAGKAFIKKLMSNTRRSGISANRYVRMFLRGLLTVQGTAVTGRIANDFAAIYAAGTLAQRMGIIPKEWGDVGRAVKSVYTLTTQGAGQTMCFDPAHELAACPSSEHLALMAA